MLDACIQFLAIRPGGTYVDMTLGGAGHAVEVLRRLGSGGLLIGIDQDENAIRAAGERLAAVDTEATYVVSRTNFENIREVLQTQKRTAADGILMDLGVSSHQLDEGERGYSYHQDAAVDMRMDRRDELTAREIVNRWPHASLARILREYGEEKWASRIASFIVKAREETPIETTGQLVEIIKAAVPASARRDGPHPARRTFQAIRMAVNRELQVLEKALDEAIDLLAPGGRLVVITFHSLEDRMVKRAFLRRVDGCTCPPDLPVCACGFVPSLRILTRKPVEADEAELAANPRSRSAKVRAAEKLPSV
jgi:16S rRNA (cytosine1402-N4)-methyltransferase